MNEILVGDCRERLPEIPSESVQAIITSPPYWNQRDYQNPKQIGMEKTPELFTETLRGVFAEGKRCLKSDGVLWLNLGDSYAAGGYGGGGRMGPERKCWDTIRNRKGFRKPPPGFKDKDLCLVPFMVATALRIDGWYMRATVIWQKRNGTEPLRLDRPSVSHEYLFLLSKSRRYYSRNPGQAWWGHSVWFIDQDREAEHQAPMPLELAQRCIAASSRPGDTILDPFSGYGTSAKAALQSGRNFMGIELNPEYAKKSETNLWQDRHQARFA